MRDLIIAAIRAELERQANLDQADTPYLYNESGEETGIDGTVNLGGLADAITHLLIEQMPTHAPFQTLVDRLTAIADRMDEQRAPLAQTYTGAMPDPLKRARRALIACDTYFAASAQAWAQHPDGIPESVGETLEHLCDAAAEAVQKALGDRRTAGDWIDPHVRDLAVNPEERIEVTDDEREALKWVNRYAEGMPSGDRQVVAPNGVELEPLIERGLLERVAFLERTWSYVWTVTPLGLRAIEQEAL